MLYERNGISSGEHFPRQMRDLTRGLLSAVEADAHDARREIVRRLGNKTSAGLKNQIIAWKEQKT
jgi:hypothetical protein